MSKRNITAEIESLQAFATGVLALAAELGIKRPRAERSATSRRRGRPRKAVADVTRPNGDGTEVNDENF